MRLQTQPYKKILRMCMKGTVEQNFLVWHAKFFPPMLIQLPSLNIFSFIPQSGTLDLASALQQVLRGYAKLSLSSFCLFISTCLKISKSMLYVQLSVM
jgi:hypothetical protein